MASSESPLLNTVGRGPNRSNMFWTVGCAYGATAVILGAFGAHGLKKRIADPAKLANWSTAAQYQVLYY